MGPSKVMYLSTCWYRRQIATMRKDVGKSMNLFYQCELTATHSKNVTDDNFVGFPLNPALWGVLNSWPAQDGVQ